jgi:glycerol-3-phosphate acyltransferase PlsY
MLPLFPLIMVICLVSWFALMKLSKKAALASVLVVPLSLILIITIGNRDAWEFFAFIGIALLIEVRHVSNIKRMLSGSENTLDVTK